MRTMGYLSTSAVEHCFVHIKIAFASAGINSHIPATQPAMSSKFAANMQTKRIYFCQLTPPFQVDGHIYYMYMYAYGHTRVKS